MVSLCALPLRRTVIIARKVGYCHMGAWSERAKVMSTRFYLTPNVVTIRFGRITLLVVCKREGTKFLSLPHSPVTK